MIACCGLDCSKCDAYIATKENNDSKRKETAEKWSRMFGHEITPGQINCEGCKSSGTNFHHCHQCVVRRCCMSKGVEHCAVCEDYICDTLAEFIKSSPRADKALEKLRKP